MKDKTTAQKQKCILVVEDNEDMCQMVALMLERAGYSVAQAADGQTALAHAKQYRPDLILMDMSLPCMSGWEAVELLRKMPEFRDTPFIAVTAHASAADQAHALAVGCTAHVSKPFKTRRLLQTIEQLLQDGENTHAS